MDYSLEHVKKAYQTAKRKGYSKKVLFPLIYENERVIDEIYDFLLKKSFDAKKLPVIYGKGDDKHVSVQMPIAHNQISILEPPIKKVRGRKYYYTTSQDKDGTVYEVRW